MKIFYIINLCFAFFQLFKCQNLASNLNVVNICAGKQHYINCNTTASEQSIVFTEAFYGIKNLNAISCSYTPGDCGEDLTLTHCGYNQATCYVNANNNRKIGNCASKKADYFRIKYYCVPYSSSNLKTYDVCSEYTITESNGFLTSPKYPVFSQQQNKSCTTKINVPAGKSINIWAIDTSLGSRDSNGECSNTFVKITDNTGTYDYCGKERITFMNQFCSNVIYISYLSIDTPITSEFRGFKLYYETYDIPSTCTTQTPAYPGPITTPSSIESTTSGKLPGQASSIYDLRICLSEPAKVIRAPLNNLVFVESYSFAVTSSNTCEDNFSPNHCVVERPIKCNLQPSCSFSLTSAIVQECGSATVNYLYVTYRFLPTKSTSLFIMGSLSSIDASSNQFGVIQSKNYPTGEKNSNFSLNIVSFGSTNSIRFYITDILIAYATNENCVTDFLVISDGISTETYCGGTSLQRTYSFETCSNTFTINYSTSSSFSIRRGFRAYYEVTSRASSCIASTASRPSISTNSQMTTLNPNADVFSQITATDSSSGVTKACYFPFSYNGKLYSSCINLDQPEYWCSFTSNYDTDKQRGNCNLGFTQNVQFDICTGKSRNFKCPTGYLTYLISAEYSVTTDGTCDYSRKKCSEAANDIITFSNAKPSVSYFASSKPLTSCSNAASNLVHIDYKCIPEKVDTLNKFEFCFGNQAGINTDYIITDNQGIIQTPNYPTFSSNLDCSVNYTSTQNKLIRVYAIFIDLEIVASNQECGFYYVQVNDEKRICGSRKTVLIHESCSNNFRVKIKSASKSFKGVKLYYEVTPITSSTLCPFTVGPTSATSLSTGTTPKPAYAVNGLASPLLTKIQCDPVGSISCAQDYTINIRETFYGISKNKQCFFVRGDCVSYEFIEKIDEDCSGKNNCNLPPNYQFALPECNNTASTYLSIRYDCLPDLPLKKNMCGIPNFTDKQGAIVGPNYPYFSTDLNCETNIMVGSKSLIKIWIKDLTLDTNCSTESLTLSQPGQPDVVFCGQVTSKFVYETCSNSLKLKLVTKNDGNRKGFYVYYEEIAKAPDYSCLPLSTPSTTQKTTPTTTFLVTTTPTRPNYYGYVSPLFSVIGCESKQVSCEPDHVIVVESSVYGVHKTNVSECVTKPDDCQADYSIPTTICPGSRNCTVTFSRLNTVGECNAKADYFEFVYRCVPTLDAGKPLQRAQEACATSNSESYTVPVGQSKIIQSPGYPSYPKNPVSCKFSITTQSGFFLKIYLNQARFPGNNLNCNTTKNYLTISDDFETYSFCSNSNNAKFLMQSKSNKINIQFETTPSVLTTVYKGFQIYVESYSSQLPSTYSPGPVTPAFIPANKESFASNPSRFDVCVGTIKSIACPSNYIILINEEYLFDTDNNGCTHGSRDCKQPTNILLRECSNKRECSIYFPETEMTRCRTSIADLLYFQFQCIPTEPPKGSKVFTCQDKKIEYISNGIIQSPDYPQYPSGLNDCSLEITPPDMNGIKFYIIDLSLSASNLSKASCGSDYLSINNNQFCGSSTAQLGYVSTDSRSIKINFKSVSVADAQSGDSIRGFKIYFETYPLSEKKTTNAITTPKSTQPSIVIVVNKWNSSNLLSYSLGFGIPILIITLVAVYILIRNKSNSVIMTNIKYNKEAADDLHSIVNPNY